MDDDILLAFSTADGRAILTHNRDDYVRLHRKTPDHGGIIVCRQSGEPEVLAEQIHAALGPLTSTQNLLIRVYLKSPPRIEAIEARPAQGEPENDDGR